MQDESIPIHIQELRWLAHFYESHGYHDKSREILSRIEKKPPDNVIDIFVDEKKKEA